MSWADYNLPDCEFTPAYPAMAGLCNAIQERRMAIATLRPYYDDVMLNFGVVWGPPPYGTSYPNYAGCQYFLDRWILDKLYLFYDANHQPYCIANDSLEKKYTALSDMIGEDLIILEDTHSHLLSAKWARQRVKIINQLTRVKADTSPEWERQDMWLEPDGNLTIPEEYGPGPFGVTIQDLCGFAYCSSFDDSGNPWYRTYWGFRARRIFIPEYAVGTGDYVLAFDADPADVWDSCGLPVSPGENVMHADVNGDFVPRFDNGFVVSTPPYSGEVDEVRVGFHIRNKRLICDISSKLTLKQED